MVSLFHESIMFKVSKKVVPRPGTFFGTIGDFNHRDCSVTSFKNSEKEQQQEEEEPQQQLSNS